MEKTITSEIWLVARRTMTLCRESELDLAVEQDPSPPPPSNVLRHHFPAILARLLQLHICKTRPWARGRDQMHQKPKQMYPIMATQHDNNAQKLAAHHWDFGRQTAAKPRGISPARGRRRRPARRRACSQGATAIRWWRISFGMSGTIIPFVRAPRLTPRLSALLPRISSPRW